MEITTTTTDRTQVQYTVTDGGWIYMDTLVFSPEEYIKLTEKDIEQTITDKYDIWKAYVTTPTPIPTKADLEGDLVKLEKEKLDIETKISLLTIKINTK